MDEKKVVEEQLDTIGFAVAQWELLVLKKKQHCPVGIWDCRLYSHFRRMKVVGLHRGLVDCARLLVFPCWFTDSIPLQKRNKESHYLPILYAA